jgi:hypothetical protein
LVTAARLLTPAGTFLRVEGAASEGILVDGGDLRKAGQQLVFEHGAAKTAAVVKA